MFTCVTFAHPKSHESALNPKKHSDKIFQELHLLRVEAPFAILTHCLKLCTFNEVLH